MSEYVKVCTYGGFLLPLCECHFVFTMLHGWSSVLGACWVCVRWGGSLVGRAVASVCQWASLLMKLFLTYTHKQSSNGFPSQEKVRLVLWRRESGQPHAHEFGCSSYTFTVTFAMLLCPIQEHPLLHFITCIMSYGWPAAQDIKCGVCLQIWFPKRRRVCYSNAVFSILGLCAPGSIMRGGRWRWTVVSLLMILKQPFQRTEPYCLC